MVPPVFHKFLTTKVKNQTNGINNTQYPNNEQLRSPNLTDIRRQINRYNEMQTILNEDAFGPLQNDSVIIVVQVMC